MNIGKKRDDARVMLYGYNSFIKWNENGSRCIKSDQIQNIKIHLFHYLHSLKK